jgi:hypothetical protein
VQSISAIITVNIKDLYFNLAEFLQNVCKARCMAPLKSCSECTRGQKTLLKHKHYPVYRFQYYHRQGH